MLPFLLITLHFSQIGFTDDLTFTAGPPFFARDGAGPFGLLPYIMLRKKDGHPLVLGMLPGWWAGTSAFIPKRSADIIA